MIHDLLKNSFFSQNMCKIKNWEVTLMLYITNILRRSFATFSAAYRIRNFQHMLCKHSLKRARIV
jgi:hypothetical protein